MVKRRWPLSVYAHGEEPDPRFTLANERTLLAGIRTSLALLAGAAAIIGLDLSLPLLVAKVVATALAITGILTAAAAAWAWWRTEVALRHNAPLPGNPSGIIVAATIVIVGATLALVPLLSGTWT